jgi:hypothetical protein
MTRRFEAASVYVMYGRFSLYLFAANTLRASLMNVLSPYPLSSDISQGSYASQYVFSSLGRTLHLPICYMMNIPASDTPFYGFILLHVRSTSMNFL